MMNEPISSIMTRNLITVSQKDSLEKVKNIFSEKNIHHMPVVDGEELVGLITTSDLLWLDEPFDNYKNIMVSSVMTKKLAVLEPTDKIGSASQVFLRNWFHAIPIVESESKKLLGIITTFDLLSYSFKKAYPDEKI
ncbi:MAG: CBS domain-containing protein [Bacteroidetes bacterium]|jgi:CBS domain-containing protein|nr:CBS domain-containing protein [Bacteroidota bacterium]